jgi:hypothetical protein
VTVDTLTTQYARIGSAQSSERWAITGLANFVISSVFTHKVTTSTKLPVLKPQFVLLGKIADGWKIIRELQLAVERDDDGYYLVSDDEFFVYGEGETLVQARRDYIISLIEYYELVARHDDAPTQTLFRYLKSYLCPIQD